MGSFNIVLEYLNQSIWYEEYNKKFGFIETGTYLGDSVADALQEPNIGPIFSIELQERFYRSAQARFIDERQVKILYGDSSFWLSNILTNRKTIYVDPFKDENLIFWLDAHIDFGNLSEETPKRNWCPLLDELNIIKNSYKFGDVITIDDIRIIKSKDGWGNEVRHEEIVDKLKEINPKFNIFYLDSKESTQDILLAY